jgi:hypothetical protein
MRVDPRLADALASNPKEVVAANVFHRAFALGPLDRPWPSNGAEGCLIVNGERRASAAAPHDYADLGTLGRVGLTIAP